MGNKGASPLATGLAGAEAPEPQSRLGPTDGIPSADYKAMRRICDPMIEAAYAMSGEEIAAAMRGFYATSESNCPWYSFALRHAMPPLLATIGHGKDDYEAAWRASGIEAATADETQSGSVHESAVAESDASTPKPLRAMAARAEVAK